MRVSIATNEMRFWSSWRCIASAIAFGLESVCLPYLCDVASDIIPFMIVTLSNNREDAYETKNNCN